MPTMPMSMPPRPPLEATMNAIRHSLMSSAAAVRNACAACYHHIFSYAYGCDWVDRSCVFCCSQEPAGIHWQIKKLGVTRELPNGRFIWNGHLWIADPTDDSIWLKPQRFPGSGKFIFVNLLSDCCHDKIPTPIIHLGFDAIAASRHYGMYSTKRCERMAEVIAAASAEEVRLWQPKCLLGFSAPGQPEFDERWPVMRALAEQGWMVYASLSPLLEPINPPDDYFELACWTIVSGEQGDAQLVRDMRPEWAEAILDKCDRVGMPFFFREMSDAAMPDGSGLVNRKTIPNVLLRRDFPDLARTRKQRLGECPVNLPDIHASPKQQQTTLINLRGTNGSGKSSVVRNLLDANDARPLYGALGRRPEAYD
jgi:protein gp37